MLPEIAAEVLHFLSRRDLDKACGVSKWLDALIPQCFEVYPLRPVLSVHLLPMWKDFPPTVLIWEMASSWTDRWFGSMDKAVKFAVSVLRRSYVQHLRVTSSDSHADSYERRTILKVDKEFLNTENTILQR
jgi:hypothetical protein